MMTKNRQLSLRYIISGLTTFAASVGSFVLLLSLIPPFFAGFFNEVTVHSVRFLLHRKFVFRDKAQYKVSFYRYMLINMPMALLTGVLSSLIIPFSGIGLGIALITVSCTIIGLLVSKNVYSVTFEFGRKK